MIESNIHRSKEPWDRRREEPPKAYSAFEIYLGLPPAERTFKEAYRLHTGNHGAAAPSDHFKGWVERYDWEERAAAWDDAEARARFDGKLKGIERKWEKLGEKQEESTDQYFDLLTQTYAKAKDIFAKELTRDNYSMAHGVQMVKLMSEGLKLVAEMQRVADQDEEGRWTEEDERNLADAMEELHADEAAEFFEEQWRRKKEEEERGSEGAGDA